MSQHRATFRAGTDAFASVDAEPAVDEVLADCEEATPDEIIALADEPAADGTAGATDAESVDEAGPILESFAVEAPERVERADRDEELGGPSMDELFGRHRP